MKKGEGRMTRDRILTLLQQHANALKDIGIARIGLFGSYSRNQATKTSDIDLVLEFLPGKKNFDTYMQACRLLESLFDIPLDIVTKESISPYLLPSIEREAIYESA